MKKLSIILLILLFPAFAFAGGGATTMMMGASGGAAAPTGITFKDYAGSSSGIITKPATTADGDLIIIWGVTNVVSALGTVPAGWTQIGTVQNAGTDSSTVCIYKIASSEGATWDMSGLMAGAAKSYAIVYSGVDTTTPLDGVTPVQEYNTSGTACGAGPITPAGNGRMIVAVYGCDPNALTTGEPDDDPACTERVDFSTSTDTYLYAQDYLQTTAAEVTLTATFSESRGHSWFTIVLRPQ